MCSFEVEGLKLNILYSAVAAVIDRKCVESYETIFELFSTALRARYDEFCSMACIEAKAEDFTILYCAKRKQRVDQSPAQSA
ncbi:MAG TPA: hypothetical protein VIJ06_03015 [Methylovirgula sp.]